MSSEGECFRPEKNNSIPTKKRLSPFLFHTKLVNTCNSFPLPPYNEGQNAFLVIRTPKIQKPTASNPMLFKKYLCDLISHPCHPLWFVALILGVVVEDVAPGAVVVGVQHIYSLCFRVDNVLVMGDNIVVVVVLPDVGEVAVRGSFPLIDC